MENKLDTRKFFGTLVGGIVFISFIIYFTYAYYNWKSSNTNVVLGIQELSTKCILGRDIEINNIGPVLNYSDGVKLDFSIKNELSEDKTIDLNLVITSISENLLVDSFKYILIRIGNSTPVISGSFVDMEVGNNSLGELTISANSTYSYLFYIYIDGNVYNDPNMQENSLIGGLEFGNCGSSMKLLSNMAVGSYVAYVGEGGTVGSTNVSCKTGGLASSSTATAETESPNSCLGQNAREDIETEEGKYGYCYNSSYKFNVKGGWRIAYIKDGKAHLVSAGAPECLSRPDSTGNVTYIQTANARALKYCNSAYVDGSCNCIDENADGLCDGQSTDVWAMGDNDFYYTTKAINGIGKRLTVGSSSLGDVGGNLGNTLYCDSQPYETDCGYNNDLIDNGGYYWFATAYSSSFSYGPDWDPSNRYVNYNGNTNAYGNRIIISLSSSVYLTGGSGTAEDPYTIGN